MSVGFCVHICKAVSSGSGTKFAGVEGENCLCFDSLNKVQPLTNRHCRLKCKGDASQICGGHGAMTVINIVDNSINEVMVTYGGPNDANFQVIRSDGWACDATDIPSPPDTDLIGPAFTTRKDRYFIICGGCYIGTDLTCSECK